MNVTVLGYLDKAGDNSSRDVVVDQVVDALTTKGHNASFLGIHADLRQVIAGLARRKPDLVFNLVESFGTAEAPVPNPDVVVAGLLDALGYRYTGGGPGELFIRQDKGLAKKLLAFDKILYPDFAVFSHDAGFETGGNLRMPLFVKPLTMDASLGITAKSLVRDAPSLMKQVLAIHEKLGDSALAEEYVEGREFYVGVLGNREPQAFPPIEMDFSGMPEGAPHVVDSKAKWDKNSAEYKGTVSKVAELADEQRAKLQKAAIDAYRALRVRDYGRVDLRLTDTGDIYVIEVNANCYLEKGSEFAMAAAAADVPYADLIARIVELAMERAELAPSKKKDVKGAKATKKT